MSSTGEEALVAASDSLTKIESGGESVPAATSSPGDSIGGSPVLLAFSAETSPAESLDLDMDNANAAPSVDNDGSSNRSASPWDVVSDPETSTSPDVVVTLNTMPGLSLVPPPPLNETPSASKDGETPTGWTEKTPGLTVTTEPVVDLLNLKDVTPTDEEPVTEESTTPTGWDTPLIANLGTAPSTQEPEAAPIVPKLGHSTDEMVVKAKGSSEDADDDGWIVSKTSAELLAASAQTQKTLDEMKAQKTAVSTPKRENPFEEESVASPTVFDPLTTEVQNGNDKIDSELETPVVETNTAYTSSPEGGRLWLQAQRIAEEKESSWREEERTRITTQLQAAAPAAVAAAAMTNLEPTSTQLARELSYPDPSVTYINEKENPDSEDDIGIVPVRTGRRVKVVQLLFIGMLGVVAGFFGSVFVSATCSFISTQVYVGMNGTPFQLHFGMWQYSPIDSVFENYSYCYGYDTDYEAYPPWIPRISALIGLMSGGFGLAVLWRYLLKGITTEKHWKWAVRALLVAGTCQALTFWFFTESVCAEQTCTMGPGAIVSLVSLCTWLLVAYEMHHNAPAGAVLAEDELQKLTEMEMSDLGYKAKAFLHRIKGDGQTDDENPSLYQLQKDSGSAERLQGIGAYRPPISV